MVITAVEIEACGSRRRGSWDQPPWTWYAASSCSTRPTTSPLSGRTERPQQVHVDLHVEDARAAHEQAMALGARLLPAAPDLHRTEGHQVYAAPAGHPFCIGWGASDSRGASHLRCREAGMTALCVSVPAEVAARPRREVAGDPDPAPTTVILATPESAAHLTRLLSNPRIHDPQVR
ncbi:hypothetical protein KM427_05475 [Nocardioides sp. LMS-CY]|uniref:VOC family protein n=1 Tax=Nocardioides sp. (strain LMS-CY) TaxID=2840457 RepID=UPI001C007AF2|nr:hypothetical protein KM427_05475 [Nocardioides sp. LMS-CY]